MGILLAFHWRAQASAREMTPTKHTTVSRSRREKFLQEKFSRSPARETCLPLYRNIELDVRQNSLRERLFHFSKVLQARHRVFMITYQVLAISWP
jgi:DNA-dependent RNA polymerase auxiliary subunit epsilon